MNLQSGGSNGSDAINVTAAQLLVSGAGTIDLECSRSVSITSAAVVQTEDGNLTVMANQQATATTGNFTGVTVDGAGTRVRSIGFSSSGNVTVKGRGGNDPGGSQLGVNVNGGAQISGSSPFSTVEVAGTGGASTGIVNRGVTVYGTGSLITSEGTLLVTGIAGTQGTGFGIGVSLLYGGKIHGGGGFGARVIGTGGGAAGSGANHGVEIGGTATPASSITSDSNAFITATAGPGASVGLYMSDAAAIGPVSLVTIGIDTVSLNDTASITATAIDNGIQISTISATHIDLGGASAAGTLGLPDALLDHLTTPTLDIGGHDSNGSDVTISAPITRSSKTDLYLRPNLGGVRAVANGTDLDLAGGKLYLEGPLTVPITGPSADTGFPQLRVLGDVSLEDFTNVPQTLNLAGTTYAGSAGNTFTILANDGNAAISSRFQDLPEGAYLVWPGNSALAAKISYVGGTGNDVTLTLRPVAEALAVTNTANDTSSGSLRAAIAFAAAHPGADTVTFDSSLNGQTITLASQVLLSDVTGATIDASSLSNGLTISGDNSTRVFEIANGSNVSLKSLTIANGYASGGGGILNNNGATLTVNNCTFTSNKSIEGSAGGAIANFGTLNANQSTFSANRASGFGGFGGAIHNNGVAATLNQCTLSLNDADVGGGVFIASGTGTFRNSIVAGNTAPGLQSSARDCYNAGSLVLAGANLVQSLGGAAPTGSGTIINATPLLAPLDNYGGPTFTMALQPGSPARNAAVGSSITSDQRFFPIIGTPDIGAYEAGTLATNYNAYIWEILPAGTTVAQHDINSDYDGDGVTNFNEYLAQTNASLASSYLHITLFTYGSSVANVTFPSVVGRHYTVEAAISLTAPVNWSPVSGTYTGTGNPITYSGSFSGFSKVFLRVRVEP